MIILDFPRDKSIFWLEHLYLYQYKEIFQLYKVIVVTLWGYSLYVSEIDGRYVSLLPNFIV